MDADHAILLFQNKLHLDRANPEKEHGQRPDSYQQLPPCRPDGLSELTYINLSEDPDKQPGCDQDSYQEFG
jgi:hypothetical protein